MKAIKISTQIADLVAKLKRAGKHHYFIFTVLLVCGLAMVVYLVDTVLRSSADNAYRDQRMSETLKAAFDQETMQKIENLQKSSEASTAPPSTAAGSRTNPFAE
jgi:hypothetical protein